MSTLFLIMAEDYNGKGMGNHFRGDQKSASWKLRAKNQYRDSISRMYFVFPKGVDTERYFLRLIHTVSRGHTSLTDIRAVRGIQYATYNDTAITSGLCESDAE